MKIERPWRVKLNKISLALVIVAALTLVHRTNAGDKPKDNPKDNLKDKPAHMTTDWSHRHLVFSTPTTQERRTRLLSNPRYVLQEIRRNAKNTSGEVPWQWNREVATPLRKDWSMYIGYNGSPGDIVPGTAGAGNYPAKFSFDPTSAYCENSAPPAGQQPDFVVLNTSLTGSGTAIPAIDTATITAEPTSGQTIIITNPNLGTTLTLTASTTTSTTGAGEGTFIRDSNTTNQAADIAASISLSGNGNLVGVSAISAGNVVTVAATTAGTAGNDILMAGNAVGVTWSFGQLQDGATGVPGIVALDNLYSGCSGTVPMPYWAYNTGGLVTTSPTLSIDGTQVIFVQSVGSTASLVILKWAAHTGDVNVPVTLATQASGTAYRNCTAPCMYTIAFSTATGGAVSPDTRSSPFYNYLNDVLYVGDDGGFLHKFTGVFSGAPAEVVSTIGNIWPASVDSGFLLTSPVFDDDGGGFGTNAAGIFVGDETGVLYRVDSTKGSGTNGIVSTAKLGNSGIDDAPVLDSTTGKVYVFIRGNLGSGASERASVIQFPVNFASGSTGASTGDTSATVSSNSTLPATAFYGGTFDNIYYNSAGGTGNMYACSTNGGLTALWKIPVTNGSLGTPVAGPTLTTANVTCSPVSEFDNGTTDRMFLSVTASSVTGTNGAGAAINCTAGGGCMMSFDITTTTGWGVTKGTSATAAEAGGTSGIIVDNSSAMSGASQVYFSPLAAENCTLYSQGIGGCAIQLSQSGASSPALVAPSITLQPAGETVPAGQTATFSVVAAGSGTLSYQWQRNGVNIALDATSSSYTTPATSSADNGATFRVVVTNSDTGITSDSATLTVTTILFGPSIITQPASQTVDLGQTATFSVIATGNPPPTYQWQKNGTNIVGATSSTYTTLATTSADNNTTFNVVISSSITSNPAALNVVSLPTLSQVQAAIEEVNNYWIANNASTGNANWDQATYYTGDLAAYDATAQANYLTYATSWATNNSYSLCSSACGEGAGGNTTNFPDYQAAGQVYIRLYQLTNTASDLTGITQSVSGMVQSNEDDEWTWIDAINMSMPDFAELASIDNNTGYNTKMYALYSYAKYSLGLYNSGIGLWWRDSTYANTSTYWSRGNGWVFAAHAKVLSVLPKSDPHYAEYLSTFITMAQALASRQQPGGYWNSDLGGTDYAGPESSGTSFFLYGLAWGLNNGILDQNTYLPIVENAWNFFVNTAIQPSGLLGYVQPTGSAPGPTTATTTEDFGVGAFLLAAQQMALLTQ